MRSKNNMVKVFEASQFFEIFWCRFIKNKFPERRFWPFCGGRNLDSPASGKSISLHPEKHWGFTILLFPYIFHIQAPPFHLLHHLYCVLWHAHSRNWYNVGRPTDKIVFNTLLVHEAVHTSNSIYKYINKIHMNYELCNNKITMSMYV